MRWLCLLKLSLLIFILGIAVHHSVAQQKISGTVVDGVTGKGVPQTSIRVQGTSDGTSCDAFGRFSLTTDAQLPLELVVSAIGYKEMLVGVDTSQKHLHIALVIDKNVYEDVEYYRRLKSRNR